MTSFQAEGECLHAAGYGEVAFNGPRGLVLTSSISPAGGLMERTVDGGQTWAVAYRGPLVVRSVQWIDKTHAAAATQNGLLVSNDAGEHWEPKVTRPGLCRFAFISPTIGFVSDDAGRLLKTDDGGQTFSVVNTSVNVRDVRFADPMRGWVAGSDGVAGTRDGGNTWHRQLELPGGSYGGWTARLDFSDGGHGAALYLARDSLGGRRPARLFVTRDGANWTERSFYTYGGYEFPPPSPPPSVGSLGGSDVYPSFSLSRGNQVVILNSSRAGPTVDTYRSGDLGQSWRQFTLSFLPIPSGSAGVGTRATDQRHWWVAVVTSNPVGNETDNKLVIGLSADGGKTWEVRKEEPIRP